MATATTVAAAAAPHPLNLASSFCRCILDKLVVCRNAARAKSSRARPEFTDQGSGSPSTLIKVDRILLLKVQSTCVLRERCPTFGSVGQRPTLTSSSIVSAYTYTHSTNREFVDVSLRLLAKWKICPGILVRRPRVCPQTLPLTIRANLPDTSVNYIELCVAISKYTKASVHACQILLTHAS